MVFSSIGSLSEISLLPFHHLKINRTSHNNHHHHFLSIRSCQQQSLQFQITTTTKKKKKKNWKWNNENVIFCSSIDDFTTSTDDTSSSSSSSIKESSTATEEEEEGVPEATKIPAAPVKRKKIRFRKEYPGESKGIVEEMRFVTMKLHNKKRKRRIRRKGETLEKENEEDPSSDKNSDSDEDGDGDGETLEAKEGETLESSDKNGDAVTWQPSIEGFIKYLVDSKLVFETLERIVNESDNTSYTYFRNIGLERSAGLAKDLEWFHQQNHVIPKPSKPGVAYVMYLEELAGTSGPVFLCHFYNIYFAHISGGQVIAKQVSEKILEGRELEFNTWKGDAFELLKKVRDNLNKLGQDWTREEKNKCLTEATKAFRYLGNIVRLIIL